MSQPFQRRRRPPTPWRRRRAAPRLPSVVGTVSHVPFVTGTPCRCPGADPAAPPHQPRRPRAASSAITSAALTRVDLGHARQRARGDPRADTSPARSSRPGRPRRGARFFIAPGLMGSFLRLGLQVDRVAMSARDLSQVQAVQLGGRHRHDALATVCGLSPRSRCPRPRACHDHGCHAQAARRIRQPPAAGSPSPAAIGDGGRHQHRDREHQVHCPPSGRPWPARRRGDGG